MPPQAMPQVQQMPPQAMPPQQQQQMQVPQQNMTKSQQYLMKTQSIIGSVQERNPHLADQVGNMIYEFVEGLVGAQKAPKITGMLIQLPVFQIKQYMTSYEALQHRVMEAEQLLTNQMKQAAMEGQQQQ